MKPSVNATILTRQTNKAKVGHKGAMSAAKTENRTRPKISGVLDQKSKEPQSSGMSRGGRVGNMAESRLALILTDTRRTMSSLRVPMYPLHPRYQQWPCSWGCREQKLPLTLQTARHCVKYLIKIILFNQYYYLCLIGEENSTLATLRIFIRTLTKTTSIRG
jgi:hypothetical protein